MTTAHSSFSPTSRRAYRALSVAIFAAAYGCANEPVTPPESAAPGELIAETAYVTAPDAQNRLWAAFVPSEGGGDLYLFDFTQRQVWKLEENVPSLAVGVAALGDRVEVDAILDLRLRQEVKALGSRAGNLRLLRRGEYVPQFELRERAGDEGSGDVAGSREALRQIGGGGSSSKIGRIDTCEIDAAYTVGSQSVAIVTNGGARVAYTETDAELAAKSEAVTGQAGAVDYCTVWGICVYCEAYNGCVSGCNDDFSTCETGCEDGYNVAIDAIDAVWQGCYDFCDDYWQGFPCAGIGRAACRADCDIADGLARAAAHVAYVGCLAGCALSNGACKEGCLAGSLAPSACCGANPPSGC